MLYYQTSIIYIFIIYFIFNYFYFIILLLLLNIITLLFLLYTIKVHMNRIRWHLKNKTVHFSLNLASTYNLLPFT